MAAVLPLPGTGDSLLGMLNLHGEVLPVVDPRPRLGLQRPQPTAEQRLVLLKGESPYLMWVDDVDEVVGLSADAISGVPAQQPSPLVPRILRLGETIVPLLSPDALEPRSSMG